MIKKRMKLLKNEFSRLIIYEGYNDFEAMVIMLIRFMRVIIPILFLFMMWTKKESKNELK
ncbi:hypothetical protein SAMN05443270_3463 [Lacrimispora sphenoides]|uniref:hypothetical protein n=1 Tax=Lacrimispora sphenoides TaxID=29370 RepID=UPI0008C517A5|nr:hypothetical protein [Lacrimispora sphenoides]SEU22276.1 hypothetical protein SAMN05443270_3463 [Lacrimispora sphenoides]